MIAHEAGSQKQVSGFREPGGRVKEQGMQRSRGAAIDAPYYSFPLHPLTPVLFLFRLIGSQGL
jgi:hypothetical protein